MTMPAPPPAPGEPPIRVGVSSCLLGAEVRYDGGHKRDRYVMDTLDPFFEWVPVCPELEVGMGVPREPVRLEGSEATPRLVGVTSRDDWTDRMETYSARRIAQLRRAELDGYILKNRSPTCGMERVKLYGAKGAPSKRGRGLFARALMEAMPSLPVEEEGRLQDAAIRENFITRVFCRHRWRRLVADGVTRRALVDFHARHKFLLMAHSERHLRALGRLVANAKAHRPSELRDRYEHAFFEALSEHATRRRHRNVLEHIAGYFKTRLTRPQRAELQDSIESYARGLLPLIVPITLVRHYTREFDVDYVRGQVYLEPHPRELMLLNHV